jgi:hypothetical protein
MCSSKQAMHLRINYWLLLLLLVLFRGRLFLLRSTILFVLFGLLFGLGSTYYRNELPHSSGRSGDYSTWWHPNMTPISIGEYLHIITKWPISAYQLTSNSCPWNPIVLPYPLLENVLEISSRVPFTLHYPLTNWLNKPQASSSNSHTLLTI